MKTFSLTTIIAVLLLSVFTCTPHRQSDQLTQQQKETILKAVKETSQRMWDFQKSYNSESLQNFMNFIDTNSDQMWQTDPVTMNYNLNIIKTRDDLKTQWRKMIESRNSTPITILEAYFAVLSKDQVLEVNKCDYTIHAKDSTTYGPFTMVNTIIWIDKNGEWKMLHCHPSWAKKKE